MSDHRSPWLRISSKDLSAEIDPSGAQLSRLCDGAGHDLLWNGDPSVWSGRAPLLFPIVGELADGVYRVKSKQYSLPRHGFARNRVFEVIASSFSSATFRLTSDDETWRVYPFRFQLDAQFDISGSSLTVTASLRNTGDGELAASFGFHPAFRWPLPYGRPRSAHVVEFEREEPAPIRRLDGNGLVKPATSPSPVVHRRLELTDSLFESDAIIFDAVRSRSVTYGAHDGPRVRVAFPDSPFLGLWSKPGAGFVCIEPWHGMADPQGYNGDFFAKPGVFTLAAAATVAFATSITIEK